MHISVPGNQSDHVPKTAWPQEWFTVNITTLSRSIQLHMAFYQELLWDKREVKMVELCVFLRLTTLQWVRNCATAVENQGTTPTPVLRKLGMAITRTTIGVLDNSRLRMRTRDRQTEASRILSRAVSIT
jgi:hypothetical protein